MSSKKKITSLLGYKDKILVLTIEVSLADSISQTFVGERKQLFGMET